MHEAFRYLSATPAKDTQVMAATPQGAPLVITRVVGKGRIVTCLVPWYEAGHTPLAKLALRLFDEIIRPVQPVRVEGLPVEWLSTSGDGEKTVLVANHDANPWCGAVRLPLDNDFGKCTELVTGSETGYRRDEDGWVACALEVPAYDVRVLRWTR
jgi:hypothetical protein